MFSDCLLICELTYCLVLGKVVWGISLFADLVWVGFGFVLAILVVLSCSVVVDFVGFDLGLVVLVI